MVEGERRVFSAQVIRVRSTVLSTFLSRLSVGALVAPGLVVYGLSSVLTASMSVDDAIGLFVLGCCASVVLALASYVTGLEARWRRGSLAVEGGLLEIERDGVVQGVPVSRVQSGIALPSEPGVELHLDDGRVVRAGMRSVDEAEELLARLGVGADHKRIAMPEPRPSRVLGAGCAAYPAAFVVCASVMATLDHAVGAAGPVLTALLVVLITLGARWVARGSRIVLGAEAIVIDGRVARFDEITRASHHGSVLTLELANGAPIRATSADADVAVALASRVERGVERARRAAKRAPIADALDPGARSLAAWRGDLAKVLERGERYRRAAIEAQDLVDLIDDPTAPPKLRVGAALALRGRNAPEDRARIRVAAEACADPRTREALEAAAAEGEVEDAVIAKAMR